METVLSDSLPRAISASETETSFRCPADWTAVKILADMLDNQSGTQQTEWERKSKREDAGQLKPSRDCPATGFATTQSDQPLVYVVFAVVAIAWANLIYGHGYKSII